MTGPRIPDDIRQQIVTEYRDGDPVEDIAARYNASRTTVQRLVRKAGLPARPPGGLQHYDREDVAYRGGWVRDGLIMRPAKAGVNA